MHSEMVKKNCKRVTNYNSSLGKTRAQLTSRSLPKLILEGRPLSQHPVKVLTLALLAYFALFANIIFKKIPFAIVVTLFFNAGLLFFSYYIYVIFLNILAFDFPLPPSSGNH